MPTQMDRAVNRQSRALYKRAKYNAKYHQSQFPDSYTRVVEFRQEVKGVKATFAGENLIEDSTYALLKEAVKKLNQLAQQYNLQRPKPKKKLKPIDPATMAGIEQALAATTPSSDDPHAEGVNVAYGADEKTDAAKDIDPETGDMVDDDDEDVIEDLLADDDEDELALDPDDD